MKPRKAGGKQLQSSGKILSAQYETDQNRATGMSTADMSRFSLVEVEAVRDTFMLGIITF